ncbi:MAG: hypothetical protein FWG04_02080 [Desulfovibrionaceae bacterium]|nr:hypothetical protein [Desulfovibrionaceae bacterium]
MAKDEHGLNLALETDSAEADDEIVDLLEVVKPGKVVSKASDADEDFSADLESMLDTLSKAEQAKAAEENDQPFPDPTPVDHEVDPDESLDMPSMDDLDDILNALGAPTQPSPSVENADAPDLPPADDMPDLDAVPVAKSSAVPVAPPSEEDLLSELGLDDHFSTPVPASAPLPETTPVDLEGLPPDINAADSEVAVEEFPETEMPEEEDAFSLDTAVGDIASESLDMERMLEPSLPAEPESEEPAQTAAEDMPVITEEDVLPALVEASLDAPAGPRFDEVDLNELDALLDDMLASAPASGPAPAGASAVASENGPESQTGTPPETAAGSVPASGSELASLRMDMDALRRDLAALRPVDTPGPSALEAKIEDMELTLHNLDSRMASLEHRQGEMYANIEKLAAEAAAKIIREELAALLEAGF